MSRNSSTSKRRGTGGGSRKKKKKRSTGRRRRKQPTMKTSTCRNAREDQTIMIEELIRRVNELTMRLREAEV